jgi:hypothetical protein
MKFKFQSHEEYSNDKTVKSFESVELDDILAQFQLFLAGVGFVWDGNLEFVPEDDTWKDYTDTGNEWPRDDEHIDDEPPVQNLNAWKWTVSELKKTGTANTKYADDTSPNAN